MLCHMANEIDLNLNDVAKDLRFKLSVGEAVFSDTPLPVAQSPAACQGDSDERGNLNLARARMESIVETAAKNRKNMTLEVCPLKHPRQNFSVMSVLAGSGESKEGNPVAFRISAVFATEEEAQEHARELQKACPLYDVIVHCMGAWTVLPLPKTDEFESLRRYVDGELDSTFQAHYQNCQAAQVRNRQLIDQAIQDGLKGQDTAQTGASGAPPTVVEFGGVTLDRQGAGPSGA